MNIHQPPHHQDKQSTKISHFPTFLRLAEIICFIIATTFIITGMVFCILNVVNIVSGPVAPIIGVLFTGVGLIGSLYGLLIQRGLRRNEK